MLCVCGVMACSVGSGGHLCSLGRPTAAAHHAQRDWSSDEEDQERQRHEPEDRQLDPNALR